MHLLESDVLSRLGVKSKSPSSYTSYLSLFCSKRITEPILYCNYIFRKSDKNDINEVLSEINSIKSVSKHIFKPLRQCRPDFGKLINMFILMLEQ